MNIQLIVSQVENLFSLPEVVMRVNEALNSFDPSNQELEEIIVCDPAFTANILKIVNSAYFGLPKSVDSISQAINFIGINALRNLAISSSVTTTFKGVPVELVDMDVFWYHSVTSAVLAKVLAKELKQTDVERLFIAGLLLSIGKLIYFTQCPEIASEILRLKDQGDRVMVDAEEEKLGFTYADLGAAFLKQWKLPANIWQLVAYHLDPLNAKNFVKDACILHVAGKLANSIEPCAKHDFDFNEIEPNIDPEVLKYLKLTPEVIESSLDASLLQVVDILSIINPKASTIY